MLALPRRSSVTVGNLSDTWRPHPQAQQGFVRTEGDNACGMLSTVGVLSWSHSINSYTVYKHMVQSSCRVGAPNLVSLMFCEH